MERIQTEVEALKIREARALEGVQVPSRATPRIENAQDMRMLKLLEQLSFFDEFSLFLLGVQRGMQQLDRYDGIVFKDDGAHLAAGRLSHPREHAPVPAEPSPVPLHHCLRVDQNECFLPGGPKAAS